MALHAVSPVFWIHLYIYLLHRKMGGCFHVEIVSLGVRRGGSFLSFFNSGPGIDMGLEDLQRTYKDTFNVTHTYLYELDSENCFELAIQADLILADWYYTKRRKADLYAFIAASCTDQVMVSRLAASWNILAISGYGTDPSVRNKTLSPTWITTSPCSRLMFTKLFVNIFTRYNWSSIYVVNDVGNYSSFVYYTGLFTTQLIKNMQLTIRKIDSQRLVNYKDILLEFQKTSRVLVFMGPGEAFRNLMMMAHTLRMTGGEHVYIGFHMFRFDEFGLMNWQYGDQHDGVAREAFRSVLLVGIAPSAQLVPDRLRDSWRARTKRRFNVTIEDTRTAVPWPIVASTYDAFIIFGQVLNETLAEKPAFDYNNGADFAQLFWNRTYHILNTTIVVRIDDKGERTPPMIVEDMDPITGLFQTVLEQDSSFYALQPVTNTSIDWGALAGTSTNPVVPLNAPLCGYEGDRCSVADSVGALIGGVLVAVTIILVGFAFCSRRHHAYIGDGYWWKIPDKALKFSSSGRSSSSENFSTL